MKRSILVASILLSISLSLPMVTSAAEPPTRSGIEAGMGLRSEGDLVRGQLDTVGFVVTAIQAEEMARAAREQEHLPPSPSGPGLIGGIAPHDDHLYSAAVTIHLSEQVTAPVVVLIGVFHKARLWDLDGVLVFDHFQAWHGPWQPMPVDHLREELIAALEPGQYVVDNTMHCSEHSIESLIPLLQAGIRDRTFVPILVPYVSWEQLDELSNALAAALAEALDRHGWQLGRDLAIVISNDAVHYGDDFEHVPFGTDAVAYQRAVERDLGMINDHLVGPLRSDSQRELLYRLVDRDDVRRYQIPWCGRFAVPFGLEVLRKVAVREGLPVPEGVLLRYGTTLSEPQLKVSEETRKAGLGYTAPSNLHHWVGFFSVGYRFP